MLHASEGCHKKWSNLHEWSQCHFCRYDPKHGPRKHVCIWDLYQTLGWEGPWRWKSFVGIPAPLARLFWSHWIPCQTCTFLPLCAVSLYWYHLSDIPLWRSPWCLSGNLVASCSKFLCSLWVSCVHPWLHFTLHCLLLSASFPALPPPIDYKLLLGLDLISWHHLGHPAHWHPQQLSWLWNWMQLTWSRAPPSTPSCYPDTLVLSRIHQAVGLGQTGLEVGLGLPPLPKCGLKTAPLQGPLWPRLTFTRAVFSFSWIGLRKTGRIIKRQCLVSQQHYHWFFLQTLKALYIVTKEWAFPEGPGEKSLLTSRIQPWLHPQPPSPFFLFLPHLGLPVFSILKKCRAGGPLPVVSRISLRDHLIPCDLECGPWTRKMQFPGPWSLLV